MKENSSSSSARISRRLLTFALIATTIPAGLAISGCGKKAETSGTPTWPANLPKIDLSKLNQAFPSPTLTQDIRSQISKIRNDLRYGPKLYENVLAELGKLAGNSTLTDAQKQAINDVMEQVKTAQATEPANPSP